MTKLCIHCHFPNNYNHYHQEQAYRVNEETKKVEYYFVEVLDGNWTDENNVCLPCQCMWKLN